MEESLRQVVRVDEVAMKYGVSCEICGSQIALNFGGLEVRVVEEGGTYVALVQIPLPGDYLDSYLLEEYSRRYRLFLHLMEKRVLQGVTYELREDIPSIVAKSRVDSLAKVVDLINDIAHIYTEYKSA